MINFHLLFQKEFIISKSDITKKSFFFNSKFYIGSKSQLIKKKRILYIPREEALKYKESFKTPGVVEMNREETSSRQLMEISDKQDNDPNVHIQKPLSCQHLVSIPIMNQSMSHDQITAAGSKHTKPSTAIMLNLSASLSTSTTTALNRPFHSSCSLSSSRSTSSLSSSSSLSRYLKEAILYDDMIVYVYFYSI